MFPILWDLFQMRNRKKAFNFYRTEKMIRGVTQNEEYKFMWNRFHRFLDDFNKEVAINDK